MALNFNGLLESRYESISQLKREYPGAIQVYADNWASNTTNTVYTVPAGFKLWVISLVLDATFDGTTAGNTARVKINGTAIMRTYGAAVASSKVVSWASKELLELVAGEALQIATSVPEMFATCSMTGYLIPSSS